MLAVSLFSFILFIGARSESDHYRAAVLEHVRFSDTSFLPRDIVKKNLDVYEIAAKTASSENADIIIYPEWGLFPHFRENREFLYDFGEDIPDPKKTNANPCDQTDLFQDRPILTRLSCIAKENGIFVVANFLDQKKCRSEESDSCDADDAINCISRCPVDGKYFFNTNVVFDRQGALVARYYKRHLYFEFDLNPHPSPEDIFFETDFGNFTTVICFDLMYRESVSAVESSGVVNVAYPTFWYDHVPFVFFATPNQQAWAMANRVNLLAANVHFKGTGTMGSGIYSGEQGALVYTHTPDDRHKILVSNVPKNVRENESVSPDAKRFVIDNGEAVQVDIEEDRHFNDECVTNVLGEANGTSEYRCHPSSTGEVDHYDFVKLEGREGTVEMCSNNFCCSVTYEADSMDESYYFAVTGKNLNFYNTFLYGVQGCFLSRCEPVGGRPCVNYILKSETVFRKVEIKGNFTTNYIFPYAVDSQIRLTDRSFWSYDRESTITYTNPNSTSSLLFLGLYGRIYELDGMVQRPK